ncbi:MAG: cysteine--tRNA ligase [Gaiellaceae bacterium]
MRLFSTLARGPVELPEPPGPIGMYFCGPTVYARAHIGNARPYLIGSWYARWLRLRGYEVTLVHNITDVDDKIFVAAPGRSGERADDATAWYLEDIGRFGLDEVDHFPRVTESIPEIVRFIADLVEREAAYEVEGDVYFRVSRWPEYGLLSGQRPDQVEEQEPNPLKEDPRDFALWKTSKPEEDRSWESPWGRGRPGWHIECSAMAARFLGPAFEIHGGGRDIVFPHHENELAQSRARGHEFARIWMHNGMLRFTGEKMSKSVGNVETIQVAVDKWGKDTLLLFFLTAHWRKPIDYSEATLLSASSQWAGLQGAYRVPRVEPHAGEWMRLEKVLDDDFNTPDALRVLHDWRGRGYWSLLDRGLNLFGLKLPDMAGTGIEIDRLVRERDDARADKRWADADRIRDEINRRGHDVIDEAEGSRAVPR